jgi:hypothetical protein
MLAKWLSSKAVSRRGFLRALAWVGAAGLVSPAAAARLAMEETDLVCERLSRFYVHHASARTVGLEYLRTRPGEADVRLLLEAICRGDRERFRCADAMHVRRLIGEQQCSDFAHGRTVQVDGWILSETEARLCALAAVTHT